MTKLKDQNTKHKKSEREPTIRSIFVLSQDNDDDAPDLSQAFRLIYQEKIYKYFSVDEDLSSFQIKSIEDGLDIVAIEIKETINESSRGYVIVGDERYCDRLEIIKKSHDETYDELVVSKEFDNHSDRAGFYWEGKETVPISCHLEPFGGRMLDYAKIFNDSYVRLFEIKTGEELFFSKFYERFTSASPDVMKTFCNTEMNSRYKMMKISLHYMLSFSVNKQGGDGIRELADLRGLYELWLESLLATVRDIDPKYSEDVGSAWKIVMAAGIAYMKNKYNVSIENQT